MQYTCEPENIGADLHIAHKDQILSIPLITPFKPEIRPSQELAFRGYNAYDQSWGLMKLGEVRLDTGYQEIKLFATNIQNGKVGECKGLILEQEIE